MISNNSALTPTGDFCRQIVDSLAFFALTTLELVANPLALLLSLLLNPFLFLAFSSLNPLPTDPLDPPYEKSLTGAARGWKLTSRITPTVSEHTRFGA